MVCLLLVSTAYAQLNPTITVDNNSGYAPLGVNFEATAEGNVAEWVWDFGYGYTTTGQNVFHEYQTPGEYQAYLTVSDFEGVSDSSSINILVYEQDTTPQVNVAFRVNMQNEAVSPEGVFLNGTFINWNLADEIRMNYSAGTIYEATVPLPVGAQVEYKFSNGSQNWANYEILDGLYCAVNTSGTDNRGFTVPSMDTLLYEVCFGTCDPCQ